jgi:hypothetical protein
LYSLFGKKIRREKKRKENKLFIEIKKRKKNKNKIEERKRIFKLTAK